MVSCRSPGAGVLALFGCCMLPDARDQGLAMTLSNTVRIALSRIGAAIAALALSPAAGALAPDLNILQLYHAAWTTTDGAPPNTYALAQTRDGYLWIGSE